MKPPKRDTARQRAWDALRDQSSPSLVALAAAAEASHTSLSPYVQALEEAGYVERSDIVITRNVGELAPIVTPNGDVLDPNTDRDLAASRHATPERQRAWENLRTKPYPSIGALAEASAFSRNNLSRYLRGLAAAGYVDLGSLRLVRDPGPIAPRLYDGRLYDLNDATLPDRLARAVRRTPSRSEWLRRAGLSPSHATRLKQMMNGTRPITPAFIAALDRDEARAAET